VTRAAAGSRAGRVQQQKLGQQRLARRSVSEGRLCARLHGALGQALVTLGDSVDGSGPLLRVPPVCCCFLLQVPAVRCACAAPASLLCRRMCGRCVVCCGLRCLLLGSGSRPDSTVQ
jgi:hypothetical protein